ncbi:copper resistance CopC family protein [Paracraurococcus lichenis]|uniref:Copper resistance protein CopC n=1 Tax=Paracraurococcus lichenis TaxID=3064888 RepID=A0ABT9E3Q8_9PROT|nr:copper resistance CopC family protein [Paracraurococcus sp. LOR1-02]MDO9710782.1 copper resistance protein CopC [Paracraurococcus sp. LOR1-02]
MPAPLACPRRRLLPGLGALSLLALSLLPRAAAAHAVVVTSDPAAGASLPAPPRQVTLRFNSRIDHVRSRLLLVGPEGAQVPLEPAPEGEPTVLEARLDPAPALAPGAWRLRWQVLAVDGHITRGDIPFTLQAR